MRLDQTPQLQAIMDRAARIADDHGLSAVGVEHVVLATLEDRHSMPAQILAQHADVPTVRGELAAALISPEDRSGQ